MSKESLFMFNKTRYCRKDWEIVVIATHSRDNGALWKIYILFTSSPVFYFDEISLKNLYKAVKI